MPLDDPLAGESPPRELCAEGHPSLPCLGTPVQPPLTTDGVDSAKVDRFWSDHFESVKRAAEVLCAFQRDLSDAHVGGAPAMPPVLVQRAVDWVVFIVRAITSLV